MPERAPSSVAQQAPLISVIMAAHNEAQHIAQAVESVCQQTWQSWELIVVDDASTDETWRILNEFAGTEPRIHLLRNGHNVGAAVSRNHALAHARGEFIALMDADDIARLDRLQIQIEYLLAHPECDVLGGGAIDIDEQGHVLRETFCRESHQAMAAHRYQECPFIHSTVVGRARVWQMLGGYDVALPRSEDYDFWLRGIEQFVYHNLMAPLIWYRWTPPTFRSCRYMSYTIWKNIRQEGKALTHSLYVLRPLAGYWLWKLRHGALQWKNS